MTVTPLLDLVRRDAETEAARRLAAARARAAGVEATTLARLADVRRETLAREEVRLRAELARARLGRERRRRLAVLGAKRGLVDRAVARATEQAWDLVGHPDAVAAVQGLARQALDYLPEEGRVVHGDPRLAAVLADVAGPLGVPVDAGLATGFGVLVTSSDGRVRVDATVASLLERAREAVAIAVVRHHEGGRP